MTASYKLTILCLVFTSYGLCDVRGNDAAADCRGDDDDTSLCKKVNELERLVTGQARLLQQLETTVFDQNSLLRQQGEQLARQGTLIQKQNVKLSQQDNTLRQLREENARDTRDLLALKDKLDTVLTTLKHNHQKFVDDTEPARSPSPQHHQATVTSQDRVVTSADSHDVRKMMTRRNDDPPRLQAVVDHMGLQLGQAMADLQALKNAHAQQTTSMQSQIQALQNSQQHASPSSTFVQWGRSHCESGGSGSGNGSSSSELVYSGVAGGGHGQHVGSAVTTLCLSLSPVPANHTRPTFSASVYGAEYFTYDGHHLKNPVCAVCRAPFSSTLMTPGTDRCADGWVKQYSGYLMTGYQDHPGASDYVCVDSTLESRIGGDGLQGGKELFYAAARCGSLPCQPYSEAQLLTCVVCSK